MSFPISPSTGDEWTEDGIRYRFSGNAWVRKEYKNEQNVNRYSEDLTDVGLNAAIADIGVEETTLIIDQDYTVGANVVFPENINLSIVKGGSFSISSGFSVTINGSLKAEDYQIFNGDGSVIFTDFVSVYTQWWGVDDTGNDISAASNVIAIQKAINSLSSGNVIIKGDIRIAPVDEINPIINLKSNVNIVGNGHQNSIIKIIDTSGNYVAILGHVTTPLSNVKISNIKIDHNATNNILTQLQYDVFTPGRYSIYFKGENIEINNCLINDTDSIVQIYAPYQNSIETNYVKIINNKFQNIENFTAPFFITDHSTINVAGAYFLISGNEFYGTSITKQAHTAIESHATNAIITDNIISKYRDGIIFAGLNTLADVEDSIISENSLEVTKRGIYLWSQQIGTHITGYGINGLIIDSNNIEIDFKNYPDASNYSFAGIYLNTVSTLPIKNINIKNNLIRFTLESVPFIDVDFNSGGISFTTAITNIIDIENLSITNNTISDPPAIGINLHQFNAINCRISENEIINPGRTLSITPLDKERSGIYLDAQTYVNSFVVKNNIITDSLDIAKMVYGIYFDSKAASSDYEIIIENNTIESYGSDLTNFDYQYFISNLGNAFPRIIGSHKNLILPPNDVLANSKLYDLDNNIKYYTTNNGISWNQISYINDFINFGGDIKLSQTATLDEATGNENVLQINYTTNKTISGNDTAIDINKIDTSSPGASYFLNAKNGVTTKFNVQDDGAIQCLNVNSNLSNGTLGIGSRTFSNAGVQLDLVGSFTNLSGQSTGVLISPLYNQVASTAANTDLLINRTETSIGSGDQRLIDAQVASSSKFYVKNDGSNYVGGAVYNNTTQVNASTYDVLADDFFLAVDYTGTGAVTSLTLPTAGAIEGRLVIIKDTGGNAGVNNITIDTEGAELIDGQATLVINNNYGSVSLRCYNGNWYIE